MIIEFKCGLCLDVGEVAIVETPLNNSYRVVLKSGAELKVSTYPEKEPFYDRADLIKKWKFSHHSAAGG